MRALARSVLALYPLAYRRRYGEEIEALLEDSEVRFSSVADLAKGAALAHLRPSPGFAAELPPGQRVRASAVGLLACWLLFALAGLAFYKTTEEEGLHRIGELHPVLGFAHLAVQLLAILGSLGALAAIVPFAVAVLRRSRGEREARMAAILAMASVGLLLLASAGIVLLARAGGATPRGVAFGALLVWTLLAVVAGIGCLGAARRGLFAIPIRRGGLRALVVLGSLVAVAMAAMSAAAAIYLIGLLSDAASAGAQPNGPLGLLSITASLAIQVSAMLVATALGCVSSLRGWRGLHSATVS
jgi:hypothetical protein